jgi:AcrR family transcriptional regulator
MLIYHFETRDGLLREILGQARRRPVEAFTELIRVRPDEPYPVTLARAWSAISGPEGEPYLRMFSRLHDTAGEPLWPGFRRTATTDWLAPLEEGMRSLGRPELATVVLAVIRGLLMDLTQPATPHARTGPSPTSSPRSTRDFSDWYEALR